MDDNRVSRVAKNTMIMYVRLFVMTCISFYSSRLLLSTIGIEDYGLLSVVGSISTSFAAVKSFFSESTQRFLNVAKGKEQNSKSEQRAIFNLSLIIHITLVICFAILIEFFGEWLLNNVLSIPDNRKEAAIFVFQMTIISTSLGILSIPYDAVIIANEKLKAFAGLSLFNSVLGLIYILIIPYIGYDVLKTYSAIMVSIPLFSLLVQIVYCRRFEECRYSFKVDKQLLNKMFVFSGWNFLGNICFSLIHEGINFLLNIYGGLVLNAARAIAYRLKVIMNQVSSDALVAIRPLIMQKSVKESKEEYYETIFLLSRMSFFFNIIPIVPLFVFCPQILNIWLVEVPDYSVLFTRLVLIALLIRSFHEPINIMNMALGKIKRMMIVEVVVMLSFLAMIFLSLKFLLVIWLPFAILSIMEVFVIFFLILNSVFEIGFPYIAYIQRVVLPMMGLAVLSSFLSFLFVGFALPKSIIFLIFEVITVFFMEVGICYCFTNSTEKYLIKSLICKFRK